MERRQRDERRERKHHSVVREQEKSKFRSSAVKLRHLIIDEEGFDEDYADFANYLRTSRS